jgi:hypothetical protein
VNTTINKINELIQRNELPEGKYNFMSYLLSRKELSKKDITIITFSLFADGLSTVSCKISYIINVLVLVYFIQKILSKNVCHIQLIQ